MAEIETFWLAFSAYVLAIWSFAINGAMNGCSAMNGWNRTAALLADDAMTGSITLTGADEIHTHQ